mmetsp:Transcript_10549/g.13984  ORF Transcript_10549/g.13984 Transcript_10549/m.13984 type:complete len:233 (+) Transcript_10549:220-918(+)
MLLLLLFFYLSFNSNGLALFGCLCSNDQECCQSMYQSRFPFSKSFFWFELKIGCERGWASDVRIEFKGGLMTKTTTPHQRRRRLLRFISVSLKWAVINDEAIVVFWDSLAYVVVAVVDTMAMQLDATIPRLPLRHPIPTRVLLRHQQELPNEVEVVVLLLPLVTQQQPQAVVGVVDDRRDRGSQQRSYCHHHRGHNLRHLLICKGTMIHSISIPCAMACAKSSAAAASMAGG